MLRKWTKRLLDKKVLLAVFLIAVFLLFHGSCRPANLYSSWFFHSVYSISQATIIHELQPDGSLIVNEMITYSMRKPYQMLYQVFEPGRSGAISSVEIWTEDLQPHTIQYPRESSMLVEAEIWLTPPQSEIRINPKTHPVITLHIHYSMANALEVGEDVMQFFPQFWGEWDAPVSNIQYILRYPTAFFFEKAYTHPPVQWIKNETEDGKWNEISVFMASLPPYAFGEARILFSKPETLPPYAAQNRKLDWKDVHKEAEAYRLSIRAKILNPWIYLIIYGAFLALFYWLFKNPNLEYHAIYEREIPSHDPPIFINVVAKTMFRKPDHDGFGAMVMNLYRLNAIDITTKGFRPVIKIIPNFNAENMHQIERRFLYFLESIATKGEVDTDDLIVSMRDDTRASRKIAARYYEAVRNYEQEVLEIVKNWKFFSDKPNWMVKPFALITIFVSFFLPAAIAGDNTPHLLGFSLFESYLYFFGGLAPLLTSKALFGKWSKEGLLYHRKWKNFKAFLLDFSDLSQHPPQSVVLWEEYLVYATALGIADEVSAAMKKLIPHNRWMAESAHKNLYNIRISEINNSFRSLRNISKLWRFNFQFPSITSGGGGRSSGGASSGAGRAGSGFGGRKGGAR